jgi:isopenicillin-N epimerase
LNWTGTRDPAACLSVPVAIQFMQDHDWEAVRRGCHVLLREAIEKISRLVDLPPLYPLDSDLYYQMGIAPLPPNTDIVTLKTRLYDEFRVEVPLIDWNGQKFARISVQGYNTPDDLEALYFGLQELLRVV